MIAKTLECLENKYQVIYADPPWQYDSEKAGRNSYSTIKNQNKGMISGACQKYNVMPLEDICNLPVKSIAAKDCILFLWGTVPLMPYAFQVMEAWGFEYKTMLTWRKLSNVGLGYWFRGQTEHLLLGIHGSVKAFRCQRPNIVQLPVLDHSTKPAQFRSLINEVTKGLEPKIELFARERVEGWDAWGNDLPNTKQILLPLEVCYS